jgi:DNA-3-methyladenine glycosylase I
MNWYCTTAPGDPVHGPYHDDEYGLPRNCEKVLFELLSLEIFQAGLSWELILKKRATTFKAFEEFDVDTIAGYCEKDITRLLGDTGIIRNRLKVTSIIENAKCIQQMRDSYGGFSNFLEKHHPMARSGWVKLFKETFKFTGGEIVNEFLMSLGYLPGAHSPECPAYNRILAKKPPWTRVDIALFDE